VAGCFIAFVLTFRCYYATGIESFPLSVVPAVTPISGANELGLDSVKHEQLAIATATFDIGRLTLVFGLLWCVGVLLMATRYAGAYVITQKLRYQGLQVVPANWAQRISVLALQVGIKRTVRLHVSRFVNSPLTIGFIKPIILVPAGFLSNLPPAQIEAVLLHELGHIRRYDYLLNLLQSTIKTVLFFHPVIHIICKMIDTDREKACDDLAVDQNSDPKALAMGLAALRLQLTGPRISMAAVDNNNPILTRLQRLAEPIQTPKRSSQSVVFPILTGLLLLVLFGCATMAAGPENIKDKEIKAADLKNHTLGTQQVEGKTVIANVTEDGNRSELVDGASWRNLEKNRGNVKQLPAIPTLPTPPTPAIIGVTPSSPALPTPPTPLPCRSCATAAHFGTFDEDAFAEEMRKFEIEMQKFEKDMEHYAEKAKVFDAEAFAGEMRQFEIEMQQFERDMQRYAEEAASSSPVLDGWMSSDYGYKNDPATGHRRLHRGIDFAGAKNSPIFAVADGIVTTAKSKSGYGNTIEIDHGHGYKTLYGHAAKLIVKEGDAVKRGQQIAEMGSTGRANKPHVHFEVTLDGKPINPHNISHLTNQCQEHEDNTEAEIARDFKAKHKHKHDAHEKNHQHKTSYPDQERSRLVAQSLRHTDTYLRKELTQSLLADGLIRSKSELIRITNNDGDTRINGRSLPSPFCGKYNEMLSSYGLSGFHKLSVQIEPESVEIEWTSTDGKFTHRSKSNG